jgi:phosphoribosylaminoimidazolecarboxamide formyltransferase/IMP cyclohydrolase
VSTGGTASFLEKNGVSVIPVERVTNFPECLDGRVKTLNAAIFAGILADRRKESHTAKLNELGVTPIDIVAVNLYPFRRTVLNPDHTFEEAIENIDIGGPSLIRAAAKNHSSVLIAVSPDSYDAIIGRLENNGVDYAFRLRLATDAFAHTAAYDAYISRYFQKKTGDEYPQSLTMTFDKKQDLRYGENPAQSAAFYEAVSNDAGFSGIERAEYLHGIELSYNNINDAHGALALALEFNAPACVAVKHATPCGVGEADTLSNAYQKAYDCDPVSIFGGIICFNREIDEETALRLNNIFLEVIIAPGYSPKALEVLKRKKNRRLLRADFNKKEYGTEFKSVGGGLLVQRTDSLPIDSEPARFVTKNTASARQLDDMRFAMKVAKHVRSNAIVVAKNCASIGIGGGETSRVRAAEAALAQASVKSAGAVIASDAFFPFPDVVELCAKSGVTAILQPGGSKNDQASIDKCDEFGIAMAFTGARHFKH